MKIIQEVEFTMDDISDEVDFYVSDESRDDIVFESEIIQEIFDVIVKSSWFIQGNKTEGILSIGGFREVGVGRDVNISWKSITMGEDWDSDEEEDYEIDLVLTYESHIWILKPL